MTMKQIISTLIMGLLAITAWAEQPVTVHQQMNRATGDTHTSTNLMRGMYEDGTLLFTNGPDTTAAKNSAVITLYVPKGDKFHITEYEFSGSGKSTTEIPLRETMRTKAQLLKFATDSHKTVSYGTLAGEPAIFLSWTAKQPNGGPSETVKQGYLEKNLMRVYERSTMSEGGKVVSDVELAPTAIEWKAPPEKYRDEAKKKTEKRPSDRYAERNGNTVADCPTCALGPIQQADERHEKTKVQ